MSVEGKTFNKGSRSVVYRTASYMACEDCGEGAMVWDYEKKTSMCSCCGSTHGGRP